MIQDPANACEYRLADSVVKPTPYPMWYVDSFLEGKVIKNRFLIYIHGNEVN
jgi:hypothetical protein